MFTSKWKLGEKQILKCDYNSISTIISTHTSPTEYYGNKKFLLIKNVSFTLNFVGYIVNCEQIFVHTFNFYRNIILEEFLYQNENVVIS